MFTELKLYVTCFVSFFVVDFIWIGILMKDFYIQQLRSIGRMTADKFEPQIWAAVAVYIALSVGIIQFVLPKINQSTSVVSTFGIGALLGLVIYSTYDFTNLSTLKNWTLALTLVDIAWGAVLCGLVSIIVKFVRDI